MTRARRNATQTEGSGLYLQGIMRWVSVFRQLHKTNRLSWHKRRKIPAGVRKRLFIKHVVAGYREYGRALEREYKKRFG